MRMLGNLFRSFLFIGMAGLVGWYNYETHALVGVITNACFMAFGILLVSTWKRAPEPPQSLLEVVPIDEVLQAIDDRMELYTEAEKSIAEAEKSIAEAEKLVIIEE